MPSPAASTKLLRNFKGNFRAAAQSILAAGGWSDVAIERATARLQADSRKEITFDLGPAINEEVRPDGTHVYDFFEARMRVRIVTARRADQVSPDPAIVDLHENFVADALDLLAEEKAPFTEANLPYYTVKTLRPLGTRSDLDLQWFEDYTDIDFALEFGIRSAAWPV